MNTTTTPSFKVTQVYFGADGCACGCRGNPTGTGRVVRVYFEAVAS